ncbi:hypothetical protein GE300_22255 [Rhodobacteraceae bacterium 2CG4]|uniref:Uncharacterized protein n=1 Tax=Halovulum marinum TaxID=2662447 RepID=A0A6L5Z6R9_9RHOB|nr:hypothetical protein [Halovulum marinum]MSU92256.1 hypothetical protein [Halovulum marinum]
MAGRRNRIPALAALLGHPREATRAIARGSRKLFLDRTGSGRVHIDIGGLVQPGAGAAAPW